MKKLLAILGAFGLTATGATSVIACKTPNNDNNPAVEKEDISKTVVNDPKTILDYDKTYGDLNKDETILKSVIDAINVGLSKKLKSTVTVADFNLKNDKDEKDKQVAGKVLFTVTAKSDSKLITGTFNFTNTLTEAQTGQKDITDIKVVDSQREAKSDQKYGDLNKDKTIIDSVIAAINEDGEVTVTTADFDLTNNQDENANQVPGEVLFTVTAKATSELITGEFTFKVTLTEPEVLQKDITDIKVVDSQREAKSDQKYGDLNKDKTIIDSVIAAINEDGEVTVTTADFDLTNNQDENANQVPGEVLFTVTAKATSELITGEFTFKVTLTEPEVLQKDITDIKVVDSQREAKSDQKYGDLNKDKTIIDSVIAAINEDGEVTVTTADFDLTNNQDENANQVPGEVLFTVTAKATSELITGEFTFKVTLTEPEVLQKDITDIKVVDSQREAKSDQKYGDLNKDKTIIDSVIAAINEDGEVTVTTADFDLTNNQDENANQVPGEVLFTVTAKATSELITGEFTFKVTLTEPEVLQKDITDIKVVDSQREAKSDQKYGDLNKDKTIIDSVIAAINEDGEVTVTTADFDLTNNQDENANQVPGEVLFTVTAKATSELITGEFTFKVTLTEIANI
ncbi:spiralin repeat-containing protein [Spiroplasma chrysopicola]|uniref:Uncharacterized protein n=1 Tax=Spiroplasma chrysopicola DF-1 TaxID=1276227 RepID=R4UGL5_9MOLU|nr:spiralin repeat-containing protein [Spiroplasma chrysopicola]AGM25270.1 hypothetical protein SCHRY_v1c06940 [Spiroplasma chrysopicola DF-1]